MIDTRAIRNKILDLAMQGQLTEQLPEDGTAEDLYKKMQVNRLKSTNSKPIQSIKNEDIPFEIPNNWMWKRLGSLVDVLGGKRIPAGRKLTMDNTGHKYIRVSDMKDMSVDTSKLMYVPVDIYPSISRYIIKKEDVYITVAGTIGRVGTIPDELDGANLTENADRLVFSLLNKKWLVFCLASSVVQKQINLLTTQVAQPKLAIKRIQEFCIPLPPLAEQQRIVEKIEQTFSILDIIDLLQTQYANNLTALKAKLIDAAIQGRLTEQLPEDGTAEELYQQIQAKKQALIKAGKIKKEKPLSEIREEEIPFDIPTNWKWVRLASTCNGIFAGGDKPQDFVKVKDDAHQIPVVANGVTNEGIMGYTADATAPSNTLTVAGRGTIGFPCYRNYEYFPVVRLIVIVQNENIEPKYLYYVFHSLPADSVGSSIPQLTVPMVRPKLIPLPPLAEQRRIVTRLEEILPMCEV